MKFQRTPAGYLSECGRYFIEKTDYLESDRKWRISSNEDGSSEVHVTKKVCILAASKHSQGLLEFENQ